MKNKKSPLSFIRKELKVKGKSSHSGRGFYDCYSDTKLDVLIERVKEKLNDWKEKDYIELFEVTKNGVHLILNWKKFKGSYRGFTFEKNDTDFACYMVFNEEAFREEMKEIGVVF
jgi:hypothetical protein